MSTIDEILAAGRYTDRRGRRWEHIVETDSWAAPAPDDDGDPWKHIEWRHSEKMRLLIERDQHRGECRGLWDCADHPVPRVAVIESDYGSFAPNSRVYDQHSTHSDAMNAARALAVGP
ncbi:hypothetical protein CXR25_14015 [Brevibacterium aurantiacum]|uniref:hypothetical protein n=1 Tax=Brevibacterium aurantiacum TaxID=273384 RepID=UPI000F651EDC|nr:hypothetical protein [Brevibacterium aurantiacum]AZL13811.1 hypothetical protein CXR25_14015 [Brevibacterium aurantiacum]